MLQYFSSFMMFVHQNSLDVVHKWTDPEVWCVNRSAYKEITDTEMKTLIGFIILFGIYKPNMKMFFAVMEQRWPSFSKILSHQKLQMYCILKSRRRTRSNNMLESIKYIFLIWNQHCLFIAKYKEKNPTSNKLEHFRDWKSGISIYKIDVLVSYTTV